MDTKQLIRDAKARFNHNTAKEYLKDKYQSKLIIAHQGGLFNITTDFIAFLYTRSNPEMILLDIYNNPIKVNSNSLYENAMAVYKEVMDEWHKEYNELENKR